MPTRLLSATALICALAGGAGAAAPDEQLVEQFVRLLVTDDVTAARKATGRPAEFAAAWRRAIQVMDRYDCIEVESMSGELIRGDASERLLRVTVQAKGITAGGVRLQETLPSVWLVRAIPVDGGWRIAGARTAEEQLAADLAAAASDDERRALLDPRLDLGAVAVALAYRTAEPQTGESGIPLIRFARDIAAAVGDDNKVEYARQMEALLYRMVQRHDDAIRTVLESVERCLAVCDADTLSSAYFTAGGVHWAKGDIPSAVEYFRRSAALADSMADPRRAIQAHVNLAALEGGRGHIRDAVEAADAVDRLSRKYAWLQGQLDALSVQCVLQDRLRNHAVVVRMCSKAYELAQRVGQWEDLALINFASAALGAGRLEEAARSYSRISDQSPFKVAALVYLGLALQRQGRRAEAEESFQKGIDLAIARGGDLVLAANATWYLSLLALDTDPGRAGALAQSADALALMGGTDAHATRHWDIKAAEGEALRALGRHSEAEQVLEAGLAMIERTWDAMDVAESTHASFFDDRTGVYHALIRLRVERGCFEDALRLSERLKGSLLNRIRSGERADLAAVLTDEERATRRRLEGELARLNLALLAAGSDSQRGEAVRNELRETRVRLELLETTLRARHGARHPRTTADPLLSPASLVPTSRDVILDYVVAPSSTKLFIISRNQRTGLRVEVRSIPANAEQLGESVNRFLARLAAGSFDYAEDARRLYELLIAPAESSLKDKNVVAVIPDGPLWRLPFQALQRGDGTPLVARFALFYAPSLTSLAGATTAPEPRASAVLAIGNPRFSTEAAAVVKERTRATLSDLPEAAVEARRIASLYDRESSQLLTGSQATESAIKARAGEYDILHIAAHAVTDDSQPLYSGIVLARDGSREDEDGLLEGREITRLRLQARLAVLSACSTAQGHVRPGEGLIGLSWAFLVAGCPTIVATQWRVPSESTARLMVDFHRELARGVSPAEALRRAQVRLMKDRRYRHPFYWSPFVVVGAGRS